VLHLFKSAYQPALIDILRELWLEYVKFSSKNLEVGVYMAIAKDCLDVFGIISMIRCSQRLILFKKNKIIFYSEFILQNFLIFKIKKLTKSKVDKKL